LIEEDFSIFCGIALVYDHLCELYIVNIYVCIDYLCYVYVHAFTRIVINFYARKQNASRVFAIVWVSVCPSVRLSVRLSVCLSVTLVICIKTVQAGITKSSLWAAQRSLVYRDKISCHWVQASLERGRQRGVPPLERRHSAVIGSNNVKTVADRYTHPAYHNKHW